MIDESFKVSSKQGISFFLTILKGLCSPPKHAELSMAAMKVARAVSECHFVKSMIYGCRPFMKNVA